jgi:GNAT superfamily N-acetyltransferase
MRRIVDTFLMNTTPVNTAFRAFLQGPDGGYQGDLKGAALVDYEHEKCLAMAAILPDRTWYVYSTEKPALMRLLDVALVKLRPRVIEGELSVVWQALEHPLLAANPGPRTQECVHLELAPRKIPHTPEGHHRFAQLGDIPRLEEYMVEYKAEVGELPPHDWKTMIAENRILLSIMEGTVASVAQRGPTTLDRMLIAAIFTFRPFRKRGLARNLVAALARQAAGRGQSTSTIAAKDNKATLALLDSLQFNKTAEYLKAVFETEEGNESEGRENS